MGTMLDQAELRGEARGEARGEKRGIEKGREEQRKLDEAELKKQADMIAAQATEIAQLKAQLAKKE